MSDGQLGLFAVDEDTGRGGTKAGPKAQAVLKPIYWRDDLEGVDSLAWFAEEYLTVPRGKGAGGPMTLRKWQKKWRRGSTAPSAL